MKIDFKYDIGDTVYFCLDYLHIYKAKVHERYANYKEETNRVSVAILYTVLFYEDGNPRQTCLPEELLHKTPDGLYLELE